MAKRTKSARGEVVDFDLLAIQAQEAINTANKTKAVPLAIDIKPAESFLDKRNRRRIKKAIADQPTATVDTNTTSTDVSST